MDVSSWKLIADSRLKFAGADPEFHKVSIRSANTNDHLNNREIVLGARFQEYLPYISNYEVRSDDTWIISYPRSGTTWVQEMVWLINDDYDYERAESRPLTQRSPTLRNLIRDQNEEKSLNVDYGAHFGRQFSPPHNIKNHLPAAFLPNHIRTVKPKMIYVARNPKDSAISFYYFYKRVYNYDGTLEEFLSFVVDGFAEFGSQTRHILDFWNLRNEENVLFLTYEEMQSDLKKVLKTVATFLGKTITNTQLDEMNNFLDFGTMRERLVSENPKRGASFLGIPHQLFRGGKCGSHKDEMNEEIIKKFNELIERELTANGCDVYA